MFAQVKKMAASEQYNRCEPNDLIEIKTAEGETMRECLICCLSISIAVIIGFGTPEASADDIYGFALAEAAGAGGTLWLSDLEVLAIGPEDAVYTIEFLDGTASPPQLSKTLEADQAVRFANILGSEFGLSSAFGGFRMSKLHPF